MEASPPLLPPPLAAAVAAVAVVAAVAAVAAVRRRWRELLHQGALHTNHMAFEGKMARSSRTAEATKELSAMDLLSSCTRDLPKLCHDWGGNDDFIHEHGQVLKDAWGIIGDGVKNQVAKPDRACKAKLAGLQKLTGQSNPEFTADLEEVTNLLDQRTRSLNKLVEKKKTGGDKSAETWTNFELTRD